MDKNTGIGILLIVLILGGYTFWEQKSSEEYRKVKARYDDSIAQVNQQKAATEATVVVDEKKDSLQLEVSKKQAQQSLGTVLASQLDKKEELYTIENDHLIVKFSNKGGRIWSVEFKDFKSYTNYKSHDNSPLLFFSGDNNKFDLTFFLKTQNISTSQFFFIPDLPKSLSFASADSLKLPFRLYVDSTSYVEYLYTMYKDSYKIGCDVNFVNMKNYVDAQTTNVDLTWGLDLHLQEKGFTNENNYTTIAYKLPGETSIEEMSVGKDDKIESVNQKLEWINFKQHFFSAILVTKGSVNNQLHYKSYAENNPDQLLKTFDAKIQFPFNSQTTSTIPLEFYFAPNHFKTLKSYHYSFEKIIPLGGWIIGIINRAVVIPVFNFLRNYIGSFGLIIFILTLLIKILITPLTWKSYVSSAKMKVLKPEIDKINEKFPKSEDAMKKQKEIMALYKRTGVNMLGGCLPMLLQLPILYAMFRFFPSSIELRQENFLWADDLSAYDSILNLPFAIPFYGSHVSLFTLLMAASMFFTTKISMAQQNAGNAQMKQMNMMMLYVMPVVMLAFLNNFSSGLTYYYFLSNVITIIQTYIIRKYFVDEDELLRKMNERAKQPVKKSAFQARLDKILQDQQKKSNEGKAKNKKK